MENKNSDLSSLRIERKTGSQTSGSKKKFVISIFVFVGVVVTFALGYILWANIFTKKIEVKLVTASKITQAETSAILTASGYVVAQRKASVASKATGRLVYVGVVEGDPVKKNQIIARIANDDVKAQLQQAKANLSLKKAELLNAKNKYERQKTLYEKSLGTKSNYETAEAKYYSVLASIKVAEAQVKKVEVDLEYTNIRAPFDGTVLTKNAEVGEIVSPLGASTTSRSAVVTMADMTSLQVEADVSESNIERIKPNQNCEISLDAYSDVRYPGYVAKIVPTADRSKATVMVKVAFKKYDSKVLPEMSAKVLFLGLDTSKIVASQKPMLVVPTSSIVLRNGKMFVFKVSNEKAVAVEVTTGKKSGSYTEILSGIEDGDRVIKNVTGKIKDGVEVKVL
mgnify:CR=1 FL=1